MHAVRAGAPHDIVQKCMRVKTPGMVAYYAFLSGKELHSAAKLAFNYILSLVFYLYFIFYQNKNGKNYQKYSPYC